MVGKVEELKGKGIFGRTAKYCITWNKNYLFAVNFVIVHSNVEKADSNVEKEQRKIYKVAVIPNTSSHLEGSEGLGLFSMMTAEES